MSQWYVEVVRSEYKDKLTRCIGCRLKVANGNVKVGAGKE